MNLIDERIRFVKGQATDLDLLNRKVIWPITSNQSIMTFW
jgi:hypothetical protein